MASAKGARTGAVWGAGLLEANQPKVLGELQTGYDTSRGLIGQGYDAAQGFLGQGLGYLGQAGDLYAGQRAAAQPGMDRYTALTTGDGASMSQALEGTPGYQFSLSQGLQALNRRRAAGGMLNSGNADADAIALGSGLASQTLAQERQALMPYLGMYTGGVQGGAGNFGNMANVAGQQANTATGAYGAQAGLATDYYGNRASVYDDTTKNIVGLGVSALKAGDAAKSANQAMMMQGANAAIGLLGGSGGGGFTKLFGG